VTTRHGAVTSSSACAAFSTRRERVDRLGELERRVQCAAFAPAGHIRHRLAIDLQADRAAHDKGHGVDDDLGSRAAELLIPDPEGVGELDPDTSDAGSTSP
jgi:hypothetical protein